MRITDLSHRNKISLKESMRIIMELQMIGAAIKDTKTGKIYGPSDVHFLVRDSEEMRRDFKQDGQSDSDYDDMLFDLETQGRHVDGFVDDDGNFYDRVEALKATKLKTSKDDDIGFADRNWLDSDDIYNAGGSLPIKENDEPGVPQSHPGAGAGCLVLAKATGTFLLAKRSDWVEDPDCWGTWGGGIDTDEEPRVGALREFRVETGYSGPVIGMEPLMVSGSEDFVYSTFLVIVEHEFDPEINWENAEAEWFSFGDWPKPLHFGLDELFADKSAMIKVRTVLEN